MNTAHILFLQWANVSEPFITYVEDTSYDITLTEGKNVRGELYLYVICKGFNPADIVSAM